MEKEIVGKTWKEKEEKGLVDRRNMKGQRQITK